MTKTDHHQTHVLNAMTLLRSTLFMIVLVLPALANAALPPAAAAKKLYADVLEAEKQRESAPDVVEIEIKNIIKLASWEDSSTGTIEDACPGVTSWGVIGKVTRTIKGDLQKDQEVSIAYDEVVMNCPGPQSFRPITLNIGETVEAYLKCDTAQSCTIAAGDFFSFVSSEEFEKIKAQQMQNLQRFSSHSNE